MCACEATFLCSRCRGDLKQDDVLLIEGDPATLEERQEAEVYRVWRETQGILPVGRAW